jgi:hypothetical protein
MLTFGIPMLFYFIMIGVMITTVITERNPDPTALFRFMKFLPLLIIIFAGAFYCWLWSIGVGLQSKVPANVKMGLKTFKIFFFIPVIYMICLLSVLAIAMTTLLENKVDPNPGMILIFISVIIPMHVFSIFCVFYSYYFVSKTFKTVELQREASFSDFAGEFFMIWFYPIGIWILQPKINKMVS